MAVGAIYDNAQIKVRSCGIEKPSLRFWGYNGKDRLSSVEMFDAVKKEWSLVAPMQCKRR